MPASSTIRKLSESVDNLRLIIGILVFGSVWGLMEATLGGFLHLIHFTYKGAITGGIAMAIMATFVVMYRRPKLAFFLAVIAATFKPLSALIYGQPIASPFVYNPVSAIVLEGLAFAAVVSLMFKGFESGIKTRVAVGVSAGYLSSVLYAVVASTVGMGNWAALGFAGRATSALTDGTALAIVGTSLLLLGHLVSMRLRPRFSELGSTRPKLYYAGSTATIAFCWVIAAVAFSLGL